MRDKSSLARPSTRTQVVHSVWWPLSRLQLATIRHYHSIAIRSQQHIAGFGILPTLQQIACICTPYTSAKAGLENKIMVVSGLAQQGF